MDLAAMLNSTMTSVEEAFEYVYHHVVDIYYLGWLAWVFYPLILTFVLPVCLLLFLYASALFLHVYRLRHIIAHSYNEGAFRDTGRKLISAMWEAQGKIWHGYEIIGMDNIPSSGRPALLVIYHGAIPADMYYLISKVLLFKNRHIRAVGDRFLFKIPGFKLLMEVFHVIPGTISSGVKIMEEGHLLVIAPGGVREAYFSDEYYNPLWGQRVGFAKIAVEAKVPVIPVFTQNCREAFRAVSIGRKYLMWLYEKTRLPIVPIYGMFPVKLRTFIGDPIPYDPEVTPEQLAVKVHTAVKELIGRHQKIPGNILRALSERFYTPSHCKQS